MGIDNKYGRVTTEFGNIGENEPVIVFRAKDKALPLMLTNYYLLCTKLGSPDNFLADVEALRLKIIDWQIENSKLVKTPD